MTDLLGRRREWGRLVRTLEGARAGDGSVLLLAGEPGIGKTRLLNEALLHASATGMTAARATCIAGGRPYWPWRQLLRALGVPHLLAQAAEGERAQLFEAVDAYVDQQAARAPVILAIDDLQWADVPSLRLLALVGRSVPGRRLVVLGAFRDADVGADHPLTATIGDIGGAGSVMALRGLPVDAVAVLLSEELPDVTADLAAKVQRRTNGNPFFVREVAHMAALDPQSIDQVPAGGRGRCAPPDRLV